MPELLAVLAFAGALVGIASAFVLWLVMEQPFELDAGMVLGGGLVAMTGGGLVAAVSFAITDALTADGMLLEALRSAGVVLANAIAVVAPAILVPTSGSSYRRP